MRLTIFARLIISYLMLFCILAAMSIYFIYHMDQFNKVTRTIVANDNFVLEFSNQLTDALLSESRFDRKFLLLKDETLYENSRKSGNTFNQLLQNAVASTNTREIARILMEIDAQHQTYMQLVKREREALKGGKPYSSILYTERKKASAESIIDQLKKIRQTSEQKALTKITDLDESSDKVRTFTIIFSVIAVSIGFVVAFAITHSIKKPLDVMRAKTLKIAQSNFDGELSISSPPEIAELASSFNAMCQKLQDVDSIKTDFFSHMSHELRTPLTSIKVGTEMLIDGLGGELTEKQLHILSIVAKESDRMINLVNSLLDLSKMEAGMMEYRFTPTDISILVQKTLDSLVPLIEEKNISIDNRIIAPQYVLVDQERVSLVLLNIIGNAIKFNTQDGVIQIVGYNNNKDKVIEIAVHDNGPGIPEGDLERIFQKFQRVITDDGDKKKGTGIGLATVKQVILAHGGKVWATSRIGKGSTMHITLPLVA